MHDDGARRAGGEVGARASRLRLLLLLQGLMSLGRCWGLHQRPPAVIPLLAMASLALTVALIVAWLRWLNACRERLLALGRRCSFGPLSPAWGLLLFLPFVSWCAQAWAVRRLSLDTDPTALPPVLEEREQAGSFRDSSVVRVATGRVARPLFGSWVAAVSLCTAAMTLSWHGWTRPLLAGVQGLALLAVALLGRQLVGAITHNLAELGRRVQAR